VGNALNNTLTGGSGANVLDGGAGNDSMTGGDGNDTYVVDSSGDTVTESNSVSTQIDLVKSSVAFTLGANLEKLQLTGTSSINGTGNDSHNTLTGNSGANRLDGGSGRDTMSGGAGNDTYVVNQASEVVIESSTVSTEIDTVEAAVSYTLTANVENLILGNDGLRGVGNGLGNTLTGGTGADTLQGGGGNDTLIGGLGNDFYIVETALDRVQETSTVSTEIDTVRSLVTYTLGDNLEKLVLSGSALINGFGNSLHNTMTGNAAANILDGGTGNDTMSGGAGADTYFVDSSTDVVTETATTDLDTVNASVSYTLTANVERLTLTGTSNIDATGNTSKNTLNGNAGNNTLDGKTGADTMSGGLGNDTYVVDNAGDVVIETSTLTGEIDTVESSITYSLLSTTQLAQVENLTLTSTGNINATGNAKANTILGNSGNNVIDGKTGADAMTGGDGNDTYYVDNAGDTVTETNTVATQKDSVISTVSFTLGTNVENLTLAGTTAINGAGNGSDNLIVGNSAINTLTAGSGSDTLIGGAGNDNIVVTGGGGADRVVLNSTVGSDTVTGFASGTDDLAFAMSAFTIGNGDTTVNTALSTTSGAAAWGSSNELIIITTDLGSLTTTAVATALGNASGIVFSGSKQLVVADTGSNTGVFLFTSNGDNKAAASELKLLVTLSGTASTVAGDYLFDA